MQADVSVRTYAKAKKKKKTKKKQNKIASAHKHKKENEHNMSHTHTSPLELRAWETVEMAGHAFDSFTTKSQRLASTGSDQDLTFLTTAIPDHCLKNIRISRQ